MSKIIIATMLATMTASGAMAFHLADFNGKTHESPRGRLCQYETKDKSVYWFRMDSSAPCISTWIV